MFSAYVLNGMDYESLLFQFLSAASVDAAGRSSKWRERIGAGV